MTSHIREAQDLLYDRSGFNRTPEAQVHAVLAVAEALEWLGRKPEQTDREEWDQLLLDWRARFESEQRRAEAAEKAIKWAMEELGPPLHDTPHSVRRAYEVLKNALPIE